MTGTPAIFMYRAAKVVIGLAYIFINAPVTSGTEQKSSDLKIIGDSAHPKPCCLPYKFQAVITNLRSFSAEDKEVSRVYRDWDNRLQVQENVVFNSQGIERTIRKSLMNFKTMVQYVYTPGSPCQQMTLDYGMLEPCMPDNAIYLGKSYIGAYNDKADFDAWNFRRTNLNRNIEMTIAVTSDKCVPVSEHLTGTIGRGQIDVLVLFTNVTEDVDSKVFHVPLECLGTQPM